MRFEVLPPVPAVTIARRLREIPLFSFASVDELFRISSISQQVRYDAQASVQERGHKVEYIQVLVSGRLRVEKSAGDAQSVEPPAMLGFREALEGTPARESARAEVESIALVMLADDFRGLLSANIELAQGLFRLLVGESGGESARLEPGGNGFVFEQRDKPLGNVDKVMYLQTLPMLARATGEELYEVATIAREISLDPGQTLAQPGEAPSIVLVLTGGLEIEGQGDVAPGRFVGVRETLAGVPWSSTLKASAPGAKALQIERDALFDLLGDRMSLLQAIFGAVFRDERDALREKVG